MEPRARAELARVIMQVLDGWGLAPGQKARLLGLPESTRARALNRYLQGTPLPDDRATDQRLSHLLSIDRALHTVLPHNAALARLWITTPNPLFMDRTPLEVMLADGLLGMQHIVEHLNGTGEW